MPKPIPTRECLKRYCPELARMVASTSWLPNPDVVRAVNRAVFPTVRGKPLYKVIDDKMYDTNMSAMWALFWTHDIKGENHSGWTIAHVWAESKDKDSYTHPANLALIPEPFAQLTDKEGPLSAYLRYHAFITYDWKPAEKEDKPAIKIDKPHGYDDIKWRYLQPVDDPLALVRSQVNSRDNKRLRLLRPIMERGGTI